MALNFTAEKRAHFYISLNGICGGQNGIGVVYTHVHKVVERRLLASSLTLVRPAVGKYHLGFERKNIPETLYVGLLSKSVERFQVM